MLDKTAQVFAILLLSLVSLGCWRSSVADSSTHNRSSVHAIILPGNVGDGVATDYIAYDRAHHRVWVPAGNTGSVDVIDTATEAVTQIKGFATTEIERNGVRRIVGPSSATIGDGIVYIGNRGDSSICAVGAESLKLGNCVKLPSSPDGLAYVATSKEVWATTPREHSIQVLYARDPGALTRNSTIQLEGQPEGYAVDTGRGLFYTNLEDQDRTITIDVASHQIKSRWDSHCGEGGPKGLAVDPSRDLLFLACPDHVNLLDTAADGKALSSMAVGVGIDNIDYVESRGQLYVAAARSATMMVIGIDQRRLTTIFTVQTASGARNAVATDEGVAYLTDSAEGKILVVTSN